MMEENISPEERLLRLIKTGQNRPVKKEQTLQIERTREKETSFSPAVGQKQAPPRSASWLLKVMQLANMAKRFSFDLVVRSVSVCVLVLFFYLLYDVIVNSPGRIEGRVLALNKTDLPALEMPQGPSAEAPQPASYYTNAVQSRNIFSGRESENRLMPTPTFIELSSNLRLQGIIFGDNPQAIIEDTKSQSVYFLHPGEYIGEIELKEILPGKAKLSYRGQEVDLSL